MKLIKPRKLGVVTRGFEHARRYFVSFGILTLHRFAGELESEADLWTFAGEELGPDGVPDAGLPKARGEFLVTGSAWAPAGTSVPASTIQVRLGSLEKTLWVYGDRFWTGDGVGGEAATEPKPFTRMPVSWATAYGGGGYAPNPVGKGHAPVEMEQRLVYALPNVESPTDPIRRMRDLPQPAGLGPLDLTWPQRMAKAGTYDATWLEERSPGLAADLNWSVFNLAPEDQQQETPFRGDEPFRIYGMHPERPLLEGRLAGVRARCFVNRRTDAGPSFEEVPLRLTTVWLFPHAERYLAVHHGLLEVAEEEGAEILHAVLAAERLEEPRPLGHYQDVLTRRLDPDAGAVHGLRDGELLPHLSPEEEASDAAAAELAAQLAMEAAAAEPVETMGEAPQARVDAAWSEANGKDGHARPMALRLEGREAADARAAALSHLTDHGSLAGHELTGCDLSELDLRGVDLSGALLENATLAGANLERAVLTGAVLAWADLTDTDLCGANLRESDLAHAQLVRTRAVRADLTDATLTGARLEGADLREAILTGADFDGAVLRGDLSGAQLRGAVLVDLDLRGLSLVGADMDGALLIRPDVRGVDFTGAHLAGATFIAAEGEGAIFAGARLSNARFVEECRFQKADFREARMDRATLRGTDLSGSVLSAVTLHGSDLSGCNLGNANLMRADARDALFVRSRLDGASLVATNLMNAILQRADLSGADLREANLFQADLARVVADPATRLDGANIKRARLHPRSVSA
jgi:uncharacterized protein YjbI with pentapeptide repeats